jgi:hypothetical protein
MRHFYYVLLLVCVAGCGQAESKQIAPPPVSNQQCSADAARIAQLENELDKCQRVALYHLSRHREWNDEQTFVHRDCLVKLLEMQVLANAITIADAKNSIAQWDRDTEADKNELENNYNFALSYMLKCRKTLEIKGEFPGSNNQSSISTTRP